MQEGTRSAIKQAIEEHFEWTGFYPEVETPFFGKIGVVELGEPFLGPNSQPDTIHIQDPITEDNEEEEDPDKFNPRWISPGSGAYNRLLFAIMDWTFQWQFESGERAKIEDRNEHTIDSNIE